MDNWLHYVFEPAIYAGFSIVMTYWLAICTAVMGAFCWEQRYRFANWWKISARERADAALNWGLMSFFAYACAQRALSTYSFAKAEWVITARTATTAPIYLPVALIGLSLIIWWMCFHRHGAQRRFWWCIWMWTGLALFAVMFFAVDGFHA